MLVSEGTVRGRPLVVAESWQTFGETTSSQRMLFPGDVFLESIS